MPALTDVPRSSEERRAFLESRVRDAFSLLTGSHVFQGNVVEVSSHHMLDACEAVDDGSDDLAAVWWKLDKTEADAAKPKIRSGSRVPGPLEIHLEGRGEEKSA